MWLRTPLEYLERYYAIDTKIDYGLNGSYHLYTWPPMFNNECFEINIAINECLKDYMHIWLYSNKKLHIRIDQFNKNVISNTINRKDISYLELLIYLKRYLISDMYKKIVRMINNIFKELDRYGKETWY